MWFGDMIRPVIGANQLCADPSEDVGVHDTTFVLVHVGQEAHRLYEVKSFFVVHHPRNHVSQGGAIADNALVCISVNLLKRTYTLAGGPECQQSLIQHLYVLHAKFRLKFLVISI